MSAHLTAVEAAAAGAAAAAAIVGGWCERALTRLRDLADDQAATIADLHWQLDKVIDVLDAETGRSMVRHPAGSRRHLHAVSSR